MQRFSPLSSLLFILSLSILSSFFFWLHSFPSTISPEKQIANELDILSEDILIFQNFTSNSIQMIGFSDHNNNLGIAVFSVESPPKLLNIGVTISRAPQVWVGCVGYKESQYYVFLNGNPELSLIKWKNHSATEQDTTPITTTIPVPPPPSMICIELDGNGAHSYTLYSHDGSKL